MSQNTSEHVAPECPKARNAPVAVVPPNRIKDPRGASAPRSGSLDFVQSTGHVTYQRRHSSEKSERSHATKCSDSSSVRADKRRVAHIVGGISQPAYCLARSADNNGPPRRDNNRMSDDRRDNSTMPGGSDAAGMVHAGCADDGACFHSTQRGEAA